MISNILDRFSFLSLFLVIVLLPVFFLPFTSIPIETSKGLLLAVGLVISIICWTMARFSDGKITLPRSFCLLSGLGIVVAFFLSAFFSAAPGVSFFGTMFDIGTFWFIFAIFLLMLASSVLLKDQKRAGMVFSGIIVSSGIVLIFQTLRLFFPQILSLGILVDKTDNILGSWNALGIFAGFIAIMALFIIEFFNVSRIKKFLLGFLLLISLFMLAAVDSSLAWGLTGVFALVIFVYKISFSFNENKEEGQERKVHFPVASFILMMISLLFFMSGPLVGSFLPNHFQLSNVEISPSFASTMSVAKDTLLKSPILGIGPNRFADAWALYKPLAINGTAFWNTQFDFGSGLLPTFAATTGILGILALLIFFFVFLITGATSLFLGIKNSPSASLGTGKNQIMPAFFIAALYLFVAAFFYPIGAVLFILAFAFTGIFVGLFSVHIPSGEITILFSNNPKKSFFSLLLLVLVMIVSFVVGFKYIERFASVPYFARALNAQTLDVAEPNIIKANMLYQNDLYLRTYSQVYLLKLNALVSKGSSLSDADKASLQTNLNEALGGAQSAIAYDKGNYQNYQMLGSVYDVVGSFGVAGSYDKAIAAYQQALSFNPLNPGLKLAMASVAFANGKTEDAINYANESLTLKPDYINAFIVLSQIAKSQGNTADAISYAQKALALSPNDTSLSQYVASLTNPSAASAVSPAASVTSPAPSIKAKQ